MASPIPENESARLTALHAYQILDTKPELAYDELTELAAQICQCPVAVIGLVDETRDWKKSKYGLPAIILRIADELKLHGRVTPKFYEGATVMFTDFQGFTQHTERMDPKGLVEQLDQIFSAFDEITDRHRLEKLKTIGDAYMCAGGLPDAQRTHPVDACLAALEIHDYMARANQQREKLRLPRWELRIGLHTGPVMAGVVGRRKFTYDVWGDAVNVAARMEAAGEAGCINLSEATMHRVKSLFEFEDRGTLEVKSKGGLRMYYLRRIRPELARDAEGRLPNDKFHLACATLFNGYVAAA